MLSAILKPSSFRDLTIEMFSFIFFWMKSVVGCARLFLRLHSFCCCFFFHLFKKKQFSRLIF